MIEIKKGFDLPISGAPRMQVEDAPQVLHVALIGDDYQDMKPTLLVAEKEQVSLGQPLFADKKNPTILYTSPASGQVVAIHRGERRRFLSLVIQLAGNSEKTFTAVKTDEFDQISAEQVEKAIRIIREFGYEPATPEETLHACNFFPRCPYGAKKCRASKPELIQIDTGHLVSCFKVHDLA